MINWGMDIRKHNELIKQAILREIKTKLLETSYNSCIFINTWTIAYNQVVLDELIQESSGHIKIENITKDQIKISLNILGESSNIEPTPKISISSDADVTKLSSDSDVTKLSPDVDVTKLSSDADIAKLPFRMKMEAQQWKLLEKSLLLSSHEPLLCCVIDNIGMINATNKKKLLDLGYRVTDLKDGSKRIEWCG